MKRYVGNRNVFLILVFIYIVTFGFFRCLGSYESSNPEMLPSNVYHRLNCDAISERSRLNMDLQSHIREIESQMKQLMNHLPNYACPLYLQKQYRRMEHDRALLIYTQKTLEERDYK